MEFAKSIPIHKNYYPKLISMKKEKDTNIFVFEMEKETPKSFPSRIKIILYKLIESNSI